MKTDMKGHYSEGHFDMPKYFYYVVTDMVI